MKKLYTLLFCCIFISTSVNAQMSMSLTHAVDTGFNGCGITSGPIYSIVNVFATVTGYNLADTFYLKTISGDGTFSTTPYVNAMDSSNGTIHLWGISYHTYLVPAVYDVTYILFDSYGNSDTLFLPAAYIFNSLCAPVLIRVYVDNNVNCIYDSGDSLINNIHFVMNNGVSIYNHGYYVPISFDAALGYNYTVFIDLTSIQNTGYNLSCPASGFINFTHNGADTIDFALSCNSDFDLKALTSVDNFKVGNSALISTLISNTSCLPQTGAYTVTLDPNLTYVSSLHPPTSNIGNTVSWNFTNLSGFSSMYNQNTIWNLSYVNLNPAVQIGDTLCYALDVTPTLGDIDQTNNSVTICKEVKSAWDPNYKDVYPAGVGASGFIPNNTELNYTIGFQNTGNATATDIYILDTLSNNVDINTLQIIFASHPMQLSIVSGNILRFQFDHILLPDSGTNQFLSHGMVVYKINTKPSLASGTTITNTAHIYFDQNAAVVTNTTLNTINITLVLTENESPILNMFPIPANDKLNIDLNNYFDGKIIVTDVLGKQVFEKNISGDKIALDVSNLNNGCYFIQLTDGVVNYTGKFFLGR